MALEWHFMALLSQQLGWISEKSHHLGSSPASSMLHHASKNRFLNLRAQDPSNSPWQLILWWKLPITSILDVFDAHSALYIYTGLWGSINLGFQEPSYYMYIPSTTLRVTWSELCGSTTRTSSQGMLPPPSLPDAARSRCGFQGCSHGSGAMFGCFMLFPRGWQQLEDRNHCPGVTE